MKKVIVTFCLIFVFGSSLFAMQPEVRADGSDEKLIDSMRQLLSHVHDADFLAAELPDTFEICPAMGHALHERLEASKQVLQLMDLQGQAMDIVAGYSADDRDILRLTGTERYARFRRRELERSRDFLKRCCLFLRRHLDLKKSFAAKGFTYPWFKFNEIFYRFGLLAVYGDISDHVLIDLVQQRSALAGWYVDRKDCIQRARAHLRLDIERLQREEQAVELAEKCAAAERAYQELCLEEKSLHHALDKKRKARNVKLHIDEKAAVAPSLKSPISAVADLENASRCDVDEEEPADGEEEFDLTSAFVCHGASALTHASPVVSPNSPSAIQSPRTADSPRLIAISRYDWRVLSWHIDPIATLKEQDYLNPVSKKYMPSEDRRRLAVIDHRLPLVIERLQKFAHKQEGYSRKYATRKNTRLFFTGAVQAMGVTRVGVMEIVIDTRSGAVYHRLFKEKHIAPPCDIAAEMESLGEMRCKQWTIEGSSERMYTIMQSCKMICITDDSDPYHACYMIFK